MEFDRLLSDQPIREVRVAGLKAMRR